MTFPRTLPEQIAELARDVADLKRRDRNRKRTGVITEVDHEKGLARVKFASPNGRDYIGGWMPWREVAAGGIKSHIPPSVGEQVDVISESGDITDGIIDMSIPSNANPRPHDGPEAVITMGDVRMKISDNRVDIDAPLLKLVGNLKVQGRIHVTEGIHDTGGVYSELGVWPPVRVYTPPVAG